MQPVERVRGDYGSLVIVILSSKLEIIGVLSEREKNGGKLERKAVFLSQLWSFLSAFLWLIFE